MYLKLFFWNEKPDRSRVYRSSIANSIDEIFSLIKHQNRCSRAFFSASCKIIIRQRDFTNAFLQTVISSGRRSWFQQTDLKRAIVHLSVIRFIPYRCTCNASNYSQSWQPHKNAISRYMMSIVIYLHVQLIAYRSSHDRRTKRDATRGEGTEHKSHLISARDQQKTREKSSR